MDDDANAKEIESTSTAIDPRYLRPRDVDAVNLFVSRRATRLKPKTPKPWKLPVVERPRERACALARRRNGVHSRVLLDDSSTDPPSSPRARSIRDKTVWKMRKVKAGGSNVFRLFEFVARVVRRERETSTRLVD